jgi:hypothetical protein
MLTDRNVPFARLATARCRIYVHDQPVLKQGGRPSIRSTAASTHHHRNMQPQPGWEQHQLATEYWLLRALKDHPWRSAHAGSADAIFVVTNRTRLCRAAYEVPFHSKERSNRQDHSALVWHSAFDGDFLKDSRQLKVISNQDMTCPPPRGDAEWLPNGGWSTIRDQTLVLEEALRSTPVTARAAILHFPTPFVTKQAPSWLVEEGGRMSISQQPPPWKLRRLLFFVGHVPKLNINPLRYYLWRQLRRDPRATVASHTINCTVGAYSACRQSIGALQARSKRYFLHDFCAEACRASWMGTNLSRCQMDYDRLSQPAEVARFRSACRKRHKQFHSAADWAILHADMHRATMNAPKTREDYLQTASRHRFCIVAPGNSFAPCRGGLPYAYSTPDPNVAGDGVSTPKLTEMVLLGGAGGCVPLIVVPHDGGPGQMVRILPYTRWLDWCRISFLVSADVARDQMHTVLDFLAKVTSQQAGAKLAALRSLRHAFAFRVPSEGSLPSAADFILSEVCYRARLFRQLSNGTALHTLTPRSYRLAGGDHQRCMVQGNTHSRSRSTIRRSTLHGPGKPRGHAHG